MAARFAACPNTRLAFQVRGLTLASGAVSGSQLLARGPSSVPIGAVVQHLRQRVAPLSAATITADSQLDVLESSFRLLGIAQQALKADAAAALSTLPSGHQAALCKAVAALLQLAREASSGRVSDRSASKSGQLSRLHRQLQQLPPHGSLSHLCLAVEVAAQLRGLMFPLSRAPPATASLSSADPLVGRSNASLYRDLALILAGLLRSDPTLREWLRPRPTSSITSGAMRTTGVRGAAPVAASASRGSPVSTATLSPIAAWNSCFRMLQLLQSCDVGSQSGSISISGAAARSIGLITNSTQAESLGADAATAAELQEGSKIAGALHQCMTLVCSGMILAVHRGALATRCCVYADADGNARRPVSWRRRGASPASFALPALELLNASKLRCAALVAAAMPHLRADADDIRASAALWYDAAVTASDLAAPAPAPASASASAMAIAADSTPPGSAAEGSGAAGGIAGALSAATSFGSDGALAAAAALGAAKPQVIAPYHAAPFAVLQRRLDDLLSVVMALRHGQDVLDGDLLAAAMRAAVACARTANHRALTEAAHAGQLRASATAVLQTCISLAPDWQALHPRYWAGASGAAAALALERCRDEARDWLVVSATLAAADVEDAAAQLGLHRGCAAGAATSTESKSDESSDKFDDADDALGLSSLSLSPLGPRPPRLQAVHLAGFLTHPRGKVYSVHRGKALRMSIAHQAAEASALVNTLCHSSVVAAVSTLHSIMLAASTDVHGWGRSEGREATGKLGEDAAAAGTGEPSKRKVPPSPLLPPAEALHAARPLLRSIVGLLRRAVEVDKLTAEGRLAPRRFAVVVAAAGSSVPGGSATVAGAAESASAAGDLASSSALASSAASASACGSGASASTIGFAESAFAEDGSSTPLLGASARRPDVGSIIYARVRSCTMHATAAAAAATASSLPQAAEGRAADAALAASLAQTRRYARNAVANLQGVLAWLVANRLVEPGAAPLTGRHKEAKAKANEEEEKQLHSESGPLWPLWMHSLVNIGSAHRSMLRCRADALAGDAAVVIGSADDASKLLSASAAATAAAGSAATTSAAAAGPYDFELEDDGLEGNSAADGEPTVLAAAAVLRVSPSGGILCRDLVSRDGAALRELASATTIVCSKHDAPLPSIGTWSHELAAPSLLRLGGPEQPHLVEVLGRSAFLLAEQREAAALARRDAQLTLRASEAAARAQLMLPLRDGPSGSGKASSRHTAPPQHQQEPIAVLAPAGSRLPEFGGDAEVVRNRLFQLLRPAAVARVRSLRVCKASVYFVTLPGALAAESAAVRDGASLPSSLESHTASASAAAGGAGAGAAASGGSPDDGGAAPHAARLRAEFSRQLKPWALFMHRRVKEYREAQQRLAGQRRRDRLVAFASAGGEGPEVHDARLQRPERGAGRPGGAPQSRQGRRGASSPPVIYKHESAASSHGDVATAYAAAPASHDARKPLTAASLTWSQSLSDFDGSSLAAGASLDYSGAGAAAVVDAAGARRRATSSALPMPAASASASEFEGLFDEGDIVDIADIVDVVDVTDVRVPPREQWVRGGRGAGGRGGGGDDGDGGWGEGGVEGDEGDEGDEGAEVGQHPQQLPRPRPDAARKLRLPSPGFVTADMRRAAEAALASGRALGDEFDDAGWSDDDGDGGSGISVGGGSAAAVAGAHAGVVGRTGGAPGVPTLPPRQLA